MGLLKGVAKYTTKIAAGVVCLVVDETMKTNLNDSVQKGINELFDGSSENAKEAFSETGVQMQEKSDEYKQWIDYYTDMPFDRLENIDPRNLSGMKRAAFIKVYKDRK